MHGRSSSGKYPVRCHGSTDEERKFEKLASYTPADDPTYTVPTYVRWMDGLQFVVEFFMSLENGKSLAVRVLSEREESIVKRSNIYSHQSELSGIITRTS